MQLAKAIASLTQLTSLQCISQSEVNICVFSTSGVRGFGRRIVCDRVFDGFVTMYLMGL